jgi:primosomal protein N' (replication factor Y)
VSFVRVAFPVPLRQTFLYSVPPELESQARPGAEVRCPFGARERRGFVVEPVREADRAGVKAILGVVGDDVVFPPDLLRLCAWIADYYLAPIGRVLAAALPGGLEGFGGSRARRQAAGGAAAAPGEPRAIGIVGSPGTPGAHRLTTAQQAAGDAIARALDARAHAAFLLHGVTGSGKTEVYLAAARAAIAGGRRVLVLVPEVALAHQVVHAFRGRFGDRVGVLHSYLALGERRATWERARRGGLDVVVGARSAIFAPLPDLGLVLVDEEHDSTYKQSEQIRYHGRDTALVRARLANAVAVLGTATPSLESFANVERGKYRRLELPERVDGRPLPVVEIVDLNEIAREAAPGAGGKPATAGATTVPGASSSASPAVPAAPRRSRRASGLFTAPLLDALAATLARREQALVFLNRRGHTRVVECEDCGHVESCPACDVALTYHRSDERFRCHYCAFERPATGACPKCASPFFRHKGSGTQRAEKELAAHFPQARVLRLDSDSARPRGEQARILGAFGRGEAEILLGTQMIAKGLDFHAVTLVGVVSADGSLHLPDFRAAERTFQTLVQVAGRAGRGTRPGRVIVQTRAADHYALVAAQQHDFAAFVARESAHRRDFGYPPYGRLVAFGLSGADEERVVDAATRVAERARLHADGATSRAAGAASQADGGVQILGPAPAPLARLRGKHRWRVTLKARDGAGLHATARATIDALERPATAADRLPAGVALTVDVDPYDLL